MLSIYGQHEQRGTKHHRDNYQKTDAQTLKITIFVIARHCFGFLQFSNDQLPAGSNILFVYDQY